MTERPGDDTAWRAALEQLPPDSRGLRRTLRLHAVPVQSEQAARRAACGYAYRPAELRPDRDWDTVTESGRCTLCELRLRRAREGGVDLVESLDLVNPDRPDARPRLSVVSELEDRTGAGPPPDRRSRDRH